MNNNVISGRVMGIDYGLKRIGIAISDLLHIISSPFYTINSVSLEKNAKKILEIANDNFVLVIVFGLPINVNCTENKMTIKVYNIIKKIKSISNIKIETIDERFTTIQTKKMLINEMNISRKKRKKIIDKISASLILRTYLDIKDIN
jgi:putative Holliday junction resolvase